MTDLAEATADPALDRVVTLDPPPVAMGQEAPPEPTLPLEGAVGVGEGHQEEGAIGGAIGGLQNPPQPANESYPEVRYNILPVIIKVVLFVASLFKLSYENL